MQTLRREPAVSRKLRRPAQIGLDIVGWSTAFAVVWSLSPASPSLVVAVAIAATTIATVLTGTSIVGGYSARWRVAEFAQIRWLLAMGLLGGLVAMLSMAIAGIGDPLLRGVDVTAIGLGLSLGVRSVWRHAHDRHLEAIDAIPETASPVIIFGAGEGGRRMINALSHDPDSGLWPVALLDDDTSLHGRQVGHLVVEGGYDAMERVAKQTGAKHMLLAIPSADRFLIRSIERGATQCGLEVTVLPTVAEMVGNVLRPDMIRKITPADLLGRQPVDLNLPERSSYLSGKTVLVTGAGGSIGSELCRQLSHLGPKTLLMLDRDESALHQLQLSIDGQAQLRSETLIVADIREADRIEEIFTRWRPDIIFHAAALKHLPLLEMHPFEGLRTNVFGSRNLLDSAKRHGVELFVNVSTDKAADPTSVLGWTKRLAERLTTQAGLEASGRYLSVRFGNVLGSRGSVLTAFEAQIDAGGPVTVTHPDITRFFMTVEEASSLVIAAGAGGHTGDVMILEMGEPVRIVDVAEDLISRSGKRIDIVFTGLRPGEKMHEVLRSTEEVIVKTDDDLMWRGAADPLRWSEIDHLDSLTDVDQLLDELARICNLPPASAKGVDILLSPPEVGDVERLNVIRTLESGWVAPAGQDLGAFEKQISDRTGAECAVALNAGTAALHLGLLVVGVKPGDEVVVQTATFAASAFAVRHAGAVPVFCDVETATGMMDPVLLEEFLGRRATQGRLPAAVMPVDLYGMCADYERLRRVCDRFGIPIVQDAAESLGSISQGKAAGSHGDVAAVSFNGNKIITTGGGGALVGPASLIERALKLATQSKEPVPHYEHREVGYNYRMSNVLASIGRAQISDLDRRIHLRGEVRDAYRRLLPGLEWIPQGVTEAPNNWLHVALLPEGVDPAATVLVLRDKGIEARRSWKPMHMQPVFETSEKLGGDVAESFYARGLCLPSSQALTMPQIERVAETVSIAIAACISTSQQAQG